MRLSLGKLIGIAIFLPILIILGISGYSFYKNYNIYMQTLESQKALQLAEKLEDVLVALGEERGTSSIYFVSKGNYPHSREVVSKKRLKMSKAITALKQFLDKNPELYKYVSDVVSYTNQLNIIRQKIDSFKGIKYKEWFFGYYTVLENKILKSLYTIAKKFPPKLQTLFLTKLPFEKITAYTGIVRGFISYYITADIPLSEEDYQQIFLGYFHSANLLPKERFDEKVLKNYFHIDKFQKLEKDIHQIIFYLQQANMEYYLNGNFNGYPIDAFDYFSTMTKRIKYFKDATQYISNQITKEAKIMSSNAKQKLIINAIALLIAVLIALLGIYVERLVNSHIKELSELISSLTPITGESIQIDISSPEGMHTAIQTVSKAIEITQESIKKSEEATKAKSLFLANMSHEIRTPLNGILGFLELLKTTELNEEQHEYLSTIEQSAKNLLQIVNNILDVSKIESNKVSLEIIDFKIVDELENTVEIFATPTSQKGIEYTTFISPDIPSVVKGDVLKIKEIITNLVNNAIKFTHKDGSINVTVRLNKIEDNKAHIYFEVKDTGIGMSEEQKNKIFEAFSQADVSVTRKYGGTGLGLTIVKSYIEMMGSSIHVESELNKGTKFFFTLEFEIVDAEPRYKANAFKNYTFAILNTSKDSARKEVTYEYLSYFGINKIGVNSIAEIDSLSKTEHINALVIFYQETSKYELTKINDNITIPIITISSYAYKEEIDKLSPDFTIYDPTTPSKVYNTSDTLKTKKRHHKAKIIKKAVGEKGTYKIYALIAEDNPINMKLLTTTLKQLGVEADTAQNGLEAFNKYSMNPEKYDVIFMDVQMPIMDGPEATQEIIEFEKEEGIEHTPIVAVTANVLKGDRERFLGAGMDDYISKPIDKKELIRVLDEISKSKSSSEEEAQIEENETIEIESTPIEKTQEYTQPTPPQKLETNLIVACESPFFIHYLEKILKENFVTAKSLRELEKAINEEKFNIILLEEDFANADIPSLISSIKNDFKNVKVVVIGEGEIPNADAVIEDLHPDHLEKIIKRLENE